MPNIYTGQNSSLEIISKTHGKITTEWTEQFDLDISLTNKKLPFFGKKDLLAISVFDGVSGRFGYLETEDKKVMSAFMDVSPSATLVNDDPSAYVEFQMLMNSKNESGVVEQGTFIKGCRITSAPESMAPREEQHVQASYIGGTRYKVKGGGIKYTRFVGSSTAYATADDVQTSGTTGLISGTLAVSATAVNIENASTTRPYLAVYRNGLDVTKNDTYTASATGFSVTGTAVVFPSSTTYATDVWELYTPYVPA